MICALLIGRDGSTGFPGKNTTRVLGRPLVEYPLLAAGKSASVERTYVSTDSSALKEIARNAGSRIIDRPDYLATKEALGEDAFVHGYETIRDELRSEGDDLELLVLLFANAPTVLPQSIDEAVRVLRDDPTIDSAVTVSCYNMWSPLRARRVDEEGLLQPFIPFEVFGDPATLNCDRDSQGDVWFADMGLSVVRPRCLENIDAGQLPQKWMGRRIYPIRQWGGLDVDYEWQMPLVEFWLRENGVIEWMGNHERT